MCRVIDILNTKGACILTINPQASVHDAAMVMNEHRVGALIVAWRGEIEGIFTERDILRRVVGEMRDPVRTCVGDVMTAELTCCHVDTSIEDVASVMRRQRIRHVPVMTDATHMAGLVSIGDINAYRVQDQECTIRSLEAYLYGEEI